MTHYVIIDFKTGCITAIFYAVPLFYSRRTLNRAFEHVDCTVEAHNFQRLVLFMYGFIISALALIFQEAIGHWLSGDPASRIEAVPNAILYAIYFSVSRVLT